MRFKIIEVYTGSKIVVIKYKLQERNALACKAFQATLKKNRLIADIRLYNEQVSISFWKIVAALCGTIPFSEVLTNKRGRNSDCSVIFKNGNPEDCSPQNLVVNYKGDVFTELEFPLQDSEERKNLKCIIDTENN
jgi:hypothetical protein